VLSHTKIYYIHPTREGGHDDDSKQYGDQMCVDMHCHSNEFLKINIANYHPVLQTNSTALEIQAMQWQGTSKHIFKKFHLCTKFKQKGLFLTINLLGNQQTICGADLCDL